MDFEESNYGVDEYGYRNHAALFDTESNIRLNQLPEELYIPNFYKSLIYGFNLRYNQFAEKIENVSTYSKFSNGSLGR